MTTSSSILRGKDPVAAGLQADDFAGLEFPVGGGVALDRGPPLAPRRRLRPPEEGERPDITPRAPQRPASAGSNLHVVAAADQLRGAAGCATGGGDVRPPAEPHRTAGDLH